MNEQDSIAIETDAPDIKALDDAFKKAGHEGDYFNRLQVAEEIRLNIWDGQSDDGKKWDENMAEGKPAFPFDGASDVRCYQADEVCNEQAAIDSTAFWRAEMRVRPVGPEDSTKAGIATTYMDWMRYGQLQSELAEEVEFSANVKAEAGWFVNHITWEREVAKKLKSIEMGELIAAANKIAQQIQSGELPLDQLGPGQQQYVSSLSIFPDLVMSPDMEQQAIDVLKFLYLAWARENMGPNLYDSDISELATKKARMAVRELRDKGQTSLPIPKLCKNQPCIRTLRPWREIVVPGYATDIQNSPFIFIIEYFTEAQLRALEMSDGWDRTWIDEVIKTKGRKSWWTWEGKSGLRWAEKDFQDHWIEVVCAYYKQVDDDGVSSVNYAWYSPHYTGDSQNEHAKSGLLDYPNNRYPLRLCRREIRDRSICSTRGVPEILQTSQREEKVQRDAYVDNTSMSVMPPVNVPKGALGQRLKFGPATQNEVVVGKEPHFMEVPTKGLVGADKYLALLDYKVSRYFGRFHEQVSPALSQLIMEPSVRKFLTCWGQSLYDAYQLSCKFAPDLVERVTSIKPEADEYEGNYDMTMHFDVGMLNPELWVQKIEAFSALLNEDHEGVIDRVKWIAIKARMIDYGLAKELVMDAAPASEKMLVEVRNELTAMFTGNQPLIKDAANDPTAPTRLKYATQTLSMNPKMLAALDPQVAMDILGPQAVMQMQQMQQMQGTMSGNQVDQLFTQYVEAYFQNLKMGAQQLENRSTGRTGVKSNAMLGS